jgi:uncharacterized protein (TIGR00297 family)
LSDLYTALVCALAVLLLVGVAEVLHRFTGVPTRLTRMSVHLASGAVAALAPWLFHRRWAPLTVALVAAFLLRLAIRRGRLPALHSARPGSLGTVWFALSAALLYLVAWDQPPLVTLPLLVLAFADPAGMLVGEGGGRAPDRRDGKSLGGSVAVFLVTGLAVTLGWQALGLGGLGRALLVGLACAPIALAAEALMDRGLDNLTLPLAIAFTLLFLLGDWYNQPAALLAAEGLALLVAVAAVRWDLLTLEGALGAFLLATWTLGGGGWAWTLPLLLFFLPASGLSRRRERLCPESIRFTDKGARRDLGQVAANGGVPLVVFAAWACGLPLTLAWPAYLGAVAAAAADTWATEIGIASGARPVLITTGRRVPPGTSGGVSPAGTAGAAAGAVMVAASSLLLAPARFSPAWLPLAVAAPAGLAASLLDSLLGATLQAQYRCPVCGEVTDRRRHCPTGEGVRVRGLAALSNDRVNLLATLVGAALAVLLTGLRPA